MTIIGFGRVDCMADLEKSQKSLQGAAEKSWKKCEKWNFTKKTGKSRETNYLKYDVLGWFWTYLSVLNRSKHEFSWFFSIFKYLEIIRDGILRILGQILFNSVQKSIFFEKLFHSVEKIVILWKIMTLSMNGVKIGQAIFLMKILIFRIISAQFCV